MRPLKLLLPVPIVRGRLRGRWWLPAAGGKVWRVLGGTYEAAQTRAFERLVSPGDAVLDLGAHLGYYTLLASLLVGRAGRVFAFEPNPLNAWFLRRHAGLNACRNVVVEEAAVLDRCGEIGFQPGSGSGTGHVSDSGSVRVRALRLDDFVQRHDLRPSIIKIDVEGAEGAVLAGAREVLCAHRPLIFLSTHAAGIHGACERILRACDYRLEALAPGGPSGEALCVPAERSLHPLPEPA